MHALAGEPAASNPADAPQASWSFQLDNDLFAGTDTNYTNGWRLSHTWSQDKSKINDLQQGLFDATGAENSDSFFDFLSPRKSNSRLEWDFGYSITQLMFTPTDRDAPKAPVGERPYAGWLGLMLTAHAKDRDSISSAGLAIGWTGEHSLAHAAQDFTHDLRDIEPFDGWDSQYPTEITLNLHLDRKWRFLETRETLGSDDLQIDAHLDYGLALGNFRTGAYLGPLARLGFNLPATYPAPRIDGSAPSHKLFVSDAPEASWSAYLFGGARGHGVLHDITLDGPLFRDTDHAVDSRPWVYEFVYGFGLRWEALDLIYSFTVRSDQFESQDDNHRFGSLLFRFNY